MKEQKLLDMLRRIGEGIFGKVHILKTSEWDSMYDPVVFRVYHGSGHCWDIRLDYTHDSERNEMDANYTFSEGWEGFKESGIDFAISEIQKIQSFFREKED